MSSSTATPTKRTNSGVEGSFFNTVDDSAQFKNLHPALESATHLTDRNVLGKPQTHSGFLRSMLFAKDDVKEWKVLNRKINKVLNIFNPEPLASEVLACTKPVGPKKRTAILRAKLGRPVYLKQSKVKLYNRQIKVNKASDEEEGSGEADGKASQAGN